MKNTGPIVEQDEREKQNARAKLSAFLKRVHTQMPDVSEEDVWRDIEKAKDLPYGSDLDI